VEWTTDHLKFMVDYQEHGSVYPPEGGFWQLGGFQGPSMWGSKMGPFDKPVSLALLQIFGNIFRIFIYLYSQQLLHLRLVSI